RDGRLSSALEERVAAGVELWRRGGAPIFCVTGGGPPERIEADAMAERARQLGIPDSALRVERESRNTGENARFAAALLREEGCRTVWIVSQPFHLFRAVFLFRKYGLEPLAWHDPTSLQFLYPRLGLRWIAREYAALVRFAAFELTDWALLRANRSGPGSRGPR
ncbi:MAG: YdcF family protein, partial [Myxococcota bacterium]